MLETIVISMTTLFATIGPLDVAAMFAVLTTGVNKKDRRKIAIKGVLVAGFLLLLFAFLGDYLLHNLGISLSAFRTAGGILLLLIAIDMVFARSSGGVSTTDEEDQEASHKTDISVFPLATPLLAGPGSMGAIMLLMADAGDDFALQASVIFSLLLILTFSFICLLLAVRIQRLFGVTGMHVITRVIGVLLAALAVQFIFDGLKQSGIFLS